MHEATRSEGCCWQRGALPGAPAGPRFENELRTMQMAPLLLPVMQGAGGFEVGGVAFGGDASVCVTWFAPSPSVRSANEPLWPWHMVPWCCRGGRLRARCWNYYNL